MKKLLILLLLPLFLQFTTEKIVYIQPLGDVNVKNLNNTKRALENFYNYRCVIKDEVSLSKDLLAASGTRYEASKILDKFKSSENIIIITEKDIAHRKSDKFPEWGIFGLGYRPGTTCVISTYRFKGKNISERLKKVSIHEVGHNLGLGHCNNQKCLMHDGKGGVKQIDQERVWFCNNCKNKLK